MGWGDNGFGSTSIGGAFGSGSGGSSSNWGSSGFGSGFSSGSSGGFGSSGWSSNERHSDGPTDPQGTHSNMCIACNASGWSNGGLMRVHYDETCPGCRFERTRAGIGGEGFGGRDYANLEKVTAFGSVYASGKNCCDDEKGLPSFLGKGKKNSSCGPLLASKSLFDTPANKTVDKPKSSKTKIENVDNFKNTDRNMNEFAPPDYNEISPRTMSPVDGNSSPNARATSPRGGNRSPNARSTSPRDRNRPHSGRVSVSKISKFKSLWTSDVPRFTGGRSLWDANGNASGVSKATQKSLWA